jgi:carbon monoxide dehydrogenase subunit G
MATTSAPGAQAADPPMPPGQGRGRRRPGWRVIEARRQVAAPPERVFEFLADLRNHWRLEDRFVALGGLDGEGEHGPTGGRIRIAGPLRVAREARTRVLAAEPPAPGHPGRLAGRANIGAATAGRVSWEIAADGDGARVRLAAVVERASLLDRALLALGGERWMRRVLERTLANLAATLSGPPGP